jgi:hypothetical protein
MQASSCVAESRLRPDIFHDTVTDLGDTGAPGQLRTLINAASPGDTIEIPTGTITLAGFADEDANTGGDLDIGLDLTIAGAGPANTVIDGANNDRVFDVFSPATVTISGLTVQNGQIGPTLDGGGIRNTGNLTLTNIIVSNNFASASPFYDDGKGGGLTCHGLDRQDHRLPARVAKCTTPQRGRW